MMPTIIVEIVGALLLFIPKQSPLSHNLYSIPIPFYFRDFSRRIGLSVHHMCLQMAILTIIFEIHAC